MAKAHVLTTSGEQIRIAFHVAVPVGNNVAGIAWTTAIRNSGLGGRTVLPDGDGTGGTISVAEKTNITTDGTVYEVVRTVQSSQIRTDTAAHANADIDALHAALVTEIQPQLQAQLNVFGYTRT